VAHYKRYGERRGVEWGDTDDENVEGNASREEIDSDMQVVPKVKGKVSTEVKKRDRLARLYFTSKSLCVKYFLAVMKDADMWILMDRQELANSHIKSTHILCFQRLPCSLMMAKAQSSFHKI